MSWARKNAAPLKFKPKQSEAAYAVVVFSTSINADQKQLVTSYPVRLQSGRQRCPCKMWLFQVKPFLIYASRLLFDERTNDDDDRRRTRPITQGRTPCCLLPAEQVGGDVRVKVGDSQPNSSRIFFTGRTRFTHLCAMQYFIAYCIFQPMGTSQ